jgi:hypothetical protein
MSVCQYEFEEECVWERFWVFFLSILINKAERSFVHSTSSNRTLRAHNSQPTRISFLLAFFLWERKWRKSITNSMFRNHFFYCTFSLCSHLSSLSVLCLLLFNIIIIQKKKKRSYILRRHKVETWRETHKLKTWRAKEKIIISLCEVHKIYKFPFCHFAIFIFFNDLIEG